MKKILLISYFLLISFIMGLVVHEAYHILETKIVLNGEVEKIEIRKVDESKPWLFNPWYFSIDSSFKTPEDSKTYKDTYKFSEMVAHTLHFSISIITFLYLINYKVSKIQWRQKCVSC